MMAPDDNQELERDMAKDGIGELGRSPADEANVLPEGSEERKDIPMATGLLDYFPAALAEVAKVSHLGNAKHNPGEPLHHARGKSMDHADTIVRHLVDRGRKDAQGVRHSAYAAWRALAQLQEELEEAGAPLARGATVEESEEVAAETIVPAPDRLLKPAGAILTEVGAGARFRRTGEFRPVREGEFFVSAFSTQVLCASRDFHHEPRQIVTRVA